MLDACQGAQADFIYADPPFNTGSKKRTPPGAKKLHRTADASYSDAFGSCSAFIDWLRPRVEATLPLLKPTGLIALHLDWRTSHRARVMLDDILGEDRFVNHLIWSYGLGGSSPRRFARKHDDILLYCLDPARYWFEPPRIPATSNRLRGKTKKMTDVLDIPAINNMAAERTGYPTQKPLALLDVLVRACCPPGGMVLDPCCGSGTTLVAAVRAGRSAIGLDVSEQAVAVAQGRLKAESRGPATHRRR
ncbi:MAG: site-specific DNA-methyltransferase [Phycisphaerales bacterium]|nr:site-specific DNA-methyltransferase [Phycisphaerales bacterium]